MQLKRLTRRQFVARASIGAAALATPKRTRAAPRFHTDANSPAVLGGAPIRTKPFPRWPLWEDADEKAILPVLRSGVWSRNKIVSEAEKKFARLMGVEYCLLTTNGTNALVTQNQCPECDRLSEETVGFHQRVLLGTTADMDDIYNAVLKIYDSRQKLL